LICRRAIGTIRMMAETTSFAGFSPKARTFLRELAAHNDRDWFQPRKAEYERLLKDPLEELCLALSVEFATRNLPLESDPRKSPFRIYRDIRFSKDKSPYKTHVSASFPWIGGGSRSGGGYFHFSADEAYVGGGMWHPEAGWLAAWRRTVDQDEDKVEAALRDRDFVATFGEVEGERLKRVPPGYPADHPGAELLKLKDVTFGKRLPDEDVVSPDLPKRIADTLAVARPVYELLAGVGS
jgi:uncharacterized protein (TIGR02453 family)